MSILDDLERALEQAHSLAFAADEAAARELLLSLMPRIEQEDRDDLLLEVFAQLGAVYLVRGANDGVGECIRRIREPLAIYRGILAGTLPEAAGQVHMSHTEINRIGRSSGKSAWPPQRACTKRPPPECNRNERSPVGRSVTT